MGEVQQLVEAVGGLREPVGQADRTGDLCSGQLQHLHQLLGVVGGLGEHHHRDPPVGEGMVQQQGRRLGGERLLPLRLALQEVHLLPQLLVGLAEGGDLAVERVQHRAVEHRAAQDQAYRQRQEHRGQ